MIHKRKQTNKHGLKINKLEMEGDILKTLASINKRIESSGDENVDDRLFYLNLVKLLKSIDSQLKSYTKLEIMKILILLNGLNYRQQNI